MAGTHQSGEYLGSGLSHYVQKGREYKEYANTDWELEEEKLGATALVKCWAEVVASKGTSDTWSTLLQKDCGSEEKGEDYLDIRQCREHWFDNIHAPLSIPKNPKIASELRMVPLFALNLLIV